MPYRPALLEPAPWLCAACHAPLGVQSDDRLALGAAHAFQDVRLVCAACGNLNLWRPGCRRRRPPEGRDGG